MEPREHAKVVSGVDAASLAAVQAFYDTIVENTVPVSSPQEAELAKLLENTFRHVNIALVNELAMFAHDLGIDVWEAIDAAATKPFGFMRFTPGPGRRRALPADRPVVPVLAGEAGARPQVPLRRAGQRRQRPHARLRRPPADGALNERRPCGQRLPDPAARVWRTSGTPATRASRRPCASPQLLDALGAEIARADPHVVEAARSIARVRGSTSTAEEVAAADAVVLLTDHDAFDLDAMVANATRTSWTAVIV